MEARVTGLKELQQKMERYPQVMADVMKATMTGVLMKLWEKVPAYPPPPANSGYKRTGTLGRSLGVSEGGAKMGQPGILQIKRLGGGAGHEARFGTRLKYAPEVIGDSQRYPFTDYWWTLAGVARGAEGEIIQIFEGAAAAIAAWLNDQAPPPKGPTKFTL